MSEHSIEVCGMSGTTPSVGPDTTPPVDPDTTPPVDPDTTPPVDPDTTPPVNPDTTPPVDPDTTPPVDPDTTPLVGPEIVLHAIQATVRSGNWAPLASAGAASGRAMRSVNRQWTAAAAPLGAPGDFFDVTFDALPGIEYNLWLRLRAEGNSNRNDAVWVQFSDSLVDGAAAYRIGTASGLRVELERCAQCGSPDGAGRMARIR